MRIVVDSSALVAILMGEPERELFHAALIGNEPVMSVVSLVEVLMVAHGRLGPAAMVEVEGMVADYRIEIAPVGGEELAELRQALLGFGRGRQAEPAVLNFGDLFAYALAKRRSAPLLYEGDDFARTDLSAVLRAADDPGRAAGNG